MDDIKIPKYICHIFDKGHVMQLDISATTPSKTVYSCPCGEVTVEHEDAAL